MISRNLFITCFLIVFTGCTIGPDLERTNTLDSGGSEYDPIPPFRGDGVNIIDSNSNELSIEWTNRGFIDGYVVRFTFRNEDEEEDLLIIDDPENTFFTDDRVAISPNSTYRIYSYVNDGDRLNIGTQPLNITALMNLIFSVDLESTSPNEVEFSFIFRSNSSALDYIEDIIVEYSETGDSNDFQVIDIINFTEITSGQTFTIDRDLLNGSIERGNFRFRQRFTDGNKEFLTPYINGNSLKFLNRYR